MLSKSTFSQHSENPEKLRKPCSLRTYSGFDFFWEPTVPLFLKFKPYWKKNCMPGRIRLKWRWRGSYLWCVWLTLFWNKNTWSDDLKRHVWPFKATRIIKICLKWHFSRCLTSLIWIFVNTNFYSMSFYSGIWSIDRTHSLTGPFPPKSGT